MRKGLLMELTAIQVEIAEKDMTRLRSGRDIDMEWYVRSRIPVDDRLRYLLKLENLLTTLDRQAGDWRLE
jgi:hypothetical protein